MGKKPQKNVKERAKPLPQKRYLTDERVKEIALGLINNSYFCSDQLREADGRLLHAIFLPVIFMKEETLKEWKEFKVVHLVAPMSSVVGGRAINGYPIFSELQPLTEEDYAAVRGLENKLRASMKEVLDGPKKEEAGGSKSPKGLQQASPSKGR